MAWSVVGGLCSVFHLVGGEFLVWSVVGGFYGRCGRWSVVGVLISIWSVVGGSWSVVCGRWLVDGRWFCTMPTFFSILH